jgi:hypothetical protein
MPRAHPRPVPRTDPGLRSRPWLLLGLCLNDYFPGSRGVVSLPTQEQQSLDLIEGGLRGSAPRLASMFAIFTRLTMDDRIPSHEAITPAAHRRISQMALELCLAVPLALSLVAVAIFLAVSTPAAHGCRPLGGAAYEVAANPTVSCQATAAKP